MSVKDKFLSKLKSSEKCNSFIFSQEKINSLVNEVQIAKVSESKTDRQRWILRHYDVITVDSTQKLIAPVTEKNPNIKYYCPVEKFSQVDVGKTVRIKIPDVDRNKADLANVLAYVLKVTDEGFYQLGTRNGILKQLFARSQFTVCEEELLTKDDLPTNEASLRTIATAQSVGDGQGMQKCSCRSKCETNKCSCKKNKFLCNSRCHQSLACCNK